MIKSTLSLLTTLTICSSGLCGVEPTPFTIATAAGYDLSARLYVPPGHTSDRQLPAIIVTGAWTSVQDQMPAIYAQALAQRGFAAITFDFSGWGESGGEPRYVEDPHQKIIDIMAVVDALTQREDIAPGAIGGLGICASAGYMAAAAARHPDLRAIALVAPWLHDQTITEQVYGGEEGVAKLIAASRQAAMGATPSIIEAASTTNTQALMYQVPYYTEPDRGAIEAYDNRFHIASWEPWLRFDALAIADHLTVPTILVHSQAAAIPHGAHAFAERLGLSANMHWLDNVTQFDFYDQPQPVAQASDLAAQHFNHIFSSQATLSTIKQTIHAMAALIDQNNYSALEAVYAETVTVDYSALGADRPVDRAATDLLRDWAAVVPGFDATFHQLGAIRVRMEHATLAHAEVPVVGTHHLNDTLWEVRGSYHISLADTAGQWQIISQTLSVSGETGPRTALSEAAAHAARNPHPYLQR